MRINQEPKGVFMLNSLKEKIDTNPAYQRGPVWSLENKQLLIDTIIRGYDIPKIYLREVDRPPFEYEVVDGQQRLRAIWDFHNGHYPLGEISDDISGCRGIGGKHFDDLPTVAQGLFLAFTLTVVSMRETPDIEIRELFLRLQEGKSLNPAEKRNAMSGGMRDFIADLAETHAVFPKTKLKNSRRQWDDLAAHVTCLELAGGPTDIKAANLKKMYEDNTAFDSSGRKAQKIKKVLNYMSKCLSTDTPEMDIKWGFVDFYCLISKFISEYSITGKESELRDLYVGFEARRRGIDELSDLLAPGHTHEDKDLYDYVEAFLREGGTRSNLETRRNVYFRWALSNLIALKAKDPNRDFSHDERIILWRKSGEKCVRCLTPVTLDEMHADHKTPHSAGGETSIFNGQCLCSRCNLAKSART